MRNHLLAAAIAAASLFAAAANAQDGQAAPDAADTEDGQAAPEEAAAPELPFHLPLPEGWRAETIPFPLGFAPELPYTGLEELRFAPGMFRPEAEDYFSYSFVWWVEPGTLFEADRLASELELYFRGLSDAVLAEAGGTPEDAVFSARVSTRHVKDVSRRRFEGRVEIHEPFAARDQLTLFLRAEAFNCIDPDHRVIYFQFSPQPEGHPVWKTLREIGEGFRCHAP